MEFTDQQVTFTEKELVVISDVMRRLDPRTLNGAVFGTRPEFESALEKIEEAKGASWMGK